MEMMQLCTGQKAIGRGVSASGAVAVDIDCGFKPSMVKVYVPEANNSGKTTIWMADVDNSDVVVDADEGLIFLHDDQGKGLNSDGITVDERGFTIGTGCQNSGSDYFWEAEC